MCRARRQCARRLTSKYANCNSGGSVKAGVRSLDPAQRWHVARSGRVEHENAVLARLREPPAVARPLFQGPGWSTMRSRPGSPTPGHARCGRSPTSGYTVGGAAGATTARWSTGHRARTRCMRGLGQCFRACRLYGVIPFAVEVVACDRSLAVYVMPVGTGRCLGHSGRSAWWSWWCC
jgi:hypothetical protein